LHLKKEIENPHGTVGKKGAGVVPDHKKSSMRGEVKKKGEAGKGEATPWEGERVWEDR